MFSTVLRGPNGEEHRGSGVYLEVAPSARLVFTDAYVSAWEPSAKPFFTAVVTLADDAGGTRYVARAVHWNEQDRAAHQALGFHEGWGKAADQLESLAKSM